LITLVQCTLVQNFPQPDLHKISPIYAMLIMISKKPRTLGSGLRIFRLHYFIWAVKQAQKRRTLTCTQKIANKHLRIIYLAN
jgi:hypothetical protein